jgi:hypothetical protein
MNTNAAPDNIESVISFGDGDDSTPVAAVIRINAHTQDHERSAKRKQNRRIKNWKAGQIPASAEQPTQAVGEGVQKTPEEETVDPSEGPAVMQANSSPKKAVTQEKILERQNNLEEMRVELKKRYGDVADDLAKASMLDVQAAKAFNSPVVRSMDYFVEKRGLSPWAALGIIDRCLCRALGVFEREAENMRAQKAKEAIERLSRQRDEFVKDELLMLALFPRVKQILLQPATDLLESGVSQDRLHNALAEARKIRSTITRLEQQRQKIVKDADLLIKSLHGVVRESVDRTVEESLRAGVPLHVLGSNLRTAEQVLASKSSAYASNLGGYRGKSSVSRSSKKGKGRQQDNKSQGGKPKAGKKGNN